MPGYRLLSSGVISQPGAGEQMPKEIVRFFRSKISAFWVRAGLSEVTGDEPPTYNCVGTRDGIAPYRIMEERIRRIQAQGTDAEIEVFEGLPHGFGLGEGTVAEGWIDNAVAFWERQMQE